MAWVGVFAVWVALMGNYGCGASGHRRTSYLFDALGAVGVALIMVFA